MSNMKCIARLFALMCALGLAATAQAQTLVGTVQGKVSDEQGAVLPGVNATLTGPRGDQTVVTDEKGEYRFVGVTPGSGYRLKVDLAGFASQERSDIVVEINRTLNVDFTLKVSSITESVDVRASASNLD